MDQEDTASDGLGNACDDSPDGDPCQSYSIYVTVVLNQRRLLVSWITMCVKVIPIKLPARATGVPGMINHRHQVQANVCLIFA